MRFTITVGVYLLLVSPESFAQEVSHGELVDQLTKWTMDDIRQNREDLLRERQEDERIRNLPDLSKYGTAIEPTRPARRRRGIDCTTIGLGRGDSMTHCD